MRLSSIRIFFDVFALPGAFDELCTLNPAQPANNSSKNR